MMHEMEREMEGMSRAFGLPMPSLGMPSLAASFFDEALPAAMPAMPAAKSLAVDIKVRGGAGQLAATRGGPCGLASGWTRRCSRPLPLPLVIRSPPATSAARCPLPRRTRAPSCRSTPTCRA